MSEAHGKSPYCQIPPEHVLEDGPLNARVDADAEVLEEIQLNGEFEARRTEAVIVESASPSNYRHETVSIGTDYDRPIINSDTLTTDVTKSFWVSSTPNVDVATIVTSPRCATFSWWWEVAAITLSICSTTLIIAILVSMNGKPLSEWQLPIQPNSLVAVFSTIAKSSLLYPLAECLGQLKWQYAETTIPLNRMEQVDSASRGPWGSTMLLYHVKKAAFLASLGAAITVLALAVEPVTQQSVGFTNRTEPLSGHYGHVPRTDAFTKMTDMKSMDQKATYLLSTGILGVATQARAPLSPLINAYCPTSECRFPTFTSLAACATCSAPKAVHIDDFSCEGRLRIDNNTEYVGSIQKLRPLFSVMSEHVQSWQFSCVTDNGDFPFLLLGSAFGFDHSIANSNETIVKSLLSRENETEITPFPPNNNVSGTRLSHFFADFLGSIQLLSERVNDDFFTTPLESSNSMRFCVNYADNRYQITSEQVGYGWISSNNFGPNRKPMRLHAYTCFQSSTDLSLWEQPERMSEINGTITQCAIDICARTYKDAVMKDGNMDIGESIEIPLRAVHVEYEDETKSVLVYNSTALFESETADPNNVQQYELGGFDQRVLSASLGLTTSDSPFWVQNSIVYLNDTNGDFKSLFDGIAEVVSTVLQHPDNPRSVSVAGPAYASQTFVEARWEWLILPLILSIATICLLVATILQSRSRPYLFKTSLLPAIFAGFDGKNGMNIDNGSLTYGHLKELSGTINVRFEQNFHSELKLKRD
ncbi:hypothetical protein N0V90_007905 [Kalmusia sp. IMI 367209]|nr:hypothetical protein N0V90_007905 [Kalmusia sp. IMI 367209]